MSYLMLITAAYLAFMVAYAQVPNNFTDKFLFYFCPLLLTLLLTVFGLSGLGVV